MAISDFSSFDKILVTSEYNLVVRDMWYGKELSIASDVGNAKIELRNFRDDNIDIELDTHALLEFAI